MSCKKCGCTLYPCRCEFDNERDFIKYGEVFLEIEPPKKRSKMAIHIPNFITNRLAPKPKSSEETRLRKILRRIFCAIERHPTADIDPKTGKVICHWCGYISKTHHFKI